MQLIFCRAFLHTALPWPPEVALSTALVRSKAWRTIGSGSESPAEYYLARYGTKDRYTESCARFRTHSYLSAIGEWEQTGEMGWFGCDDATDESREKYEVDFAEYLKEAEEQDLYITIVDMHI